MGGVSETEEKVVKTVCEMKRGSLQVSLQWDKDRHTHKDRV